MRQGTNPRRGRSRGNAKRHPSSRNQNFESNGPDVKLRGTAQQVHEKYLSLARDASSAGDRISAESYMQFADHYYRLANDQANSPNNGKDRNPRDRGNGPSEGEGGVQPDESELRGGATADTETDAPADSDEKKTETETEPASA